MGSGRKQIGGIKTCLQPCEPAVEELGSRLGVQLVATWQLRKYCTLQQFFHMILVGHS
jgi:hypothetical protein